MEFAKEWQTPLPPAGSARQAFAQAVPAPEQRLLRVHPGKETGLTYGGRKMHCGGSLGGECTETQNKGLQGRALVIHRLSLDHGPSPAHNLQ